MDESSLEFNKLYSEEEIDEIDDIFYELINLIVKLRQEGFKQKIRFHNFKPITIIGKENEIVIRQKKTPIKFSDIIAKLFNPKDFTSFNRVVSRMLLDIVGEVAMWQLGNEWGEKYMAENKIKGLNKKYQDLLVLGQKRVFSIRF